MSKPPHSPTVPPSVTTTSSTGTQKIYKDITYMYVIVTVIAVDSLLTSARFHEKIAVITVVELGSSNIFLT